MLYASIDIGTNSTRLLIARAEGQHLEPLRSEAIVTRIGRGVSETKQLQPETVGKTMEVLERFAGEIDASGARLVRAVGTSALREARNGGDFLARAAEPLGVAVEVVSGLDEAGLAFRGAVSGLEGEAGPVTVLDVGGGSTELVAGESGGPEYSDGSPSHAHSVDVGSVRLTEMFVAADPPGPAEIERMRTYAARQIEAAMGADWPAGRLIGVAGTVTTLAAVSLGLEVYDPQAVHMSRLTLEEIDRLLDMFLGMPLARRRTITGLEPDRADVIPAGTVIVQEAMKALRAEEIVVSEADLLYGLILSRVQA